MSALVRDIALSPLEDKREILAARCWRQKRPPAAVGALRDKNLRRRSRATEINKRRDANRKQVEVW